MDIKPTYENEGLTGIEGLVFGRLNFSSITLTRQRSSSLPDSTSTFSPRGTQDIFS